VTEDGTEGRRVVSGSPVFVAATRIDEQRDDVSFADALLLARLVLERGGGPVPTRGKAAFTDPVTARRLARLELAELDEGYGRSAGSYARTVWTLSASEVGTDLVRTVLAG
jgi:hypothetical protein